MLARLIQNWVYGGFLAGLLLLVLTPVLARDWAWPLVLTFLALPIYMLHQYEEHDGDRFHRMINATFGGGKDVLPSSAIFIINIPLVWGLNAASFAAASVEIGWGLVALYTLLANAIVHVAQAIIGRQYNPGLVSALALFVPLGLFGSHAVIATGAASGTQHGVALAIAVGTHIAIQAYVFANVGRSRNSG